MMCARLWLGGRMSLSTVSTSILSEYRLTVMRVGADPPSSTFSLQHFN